MVFISGELFGQSLANGISKTKSLRVTAMAVWLSAPTRIATLVLFEMAFISLLFLYKAIIAQL